MDSAATHGCPLCRTVTHFITPSIEWVTAGPYKQAIIDEYRQKLSYAYLLLDFAFFWPFFGPFFALFGPFPLT